MILNEFNVDVFAAIPEPLREWAASRYSNRHISSCDWEIWYDAINDWVDWQLGIIMNQVLAFEKYNDEIEGEFKNKYETLIVNESLPVTPGASNDMYLTGRQKTTSNADSTQQRITAYFTALGIPDPRIYILQEMGQFFRTVYCVCS